VSDIFYQLCQSCKHKMGWHRDCGKNIGTCFKCTCVEFVPTENLDYIEWLAEKRHLI
jgi:hypothetical protein